MSNDIPANAVDVLEPAEASMASLVTGIIGDLQTLVAQQVRLTRQEVATNLRLRQSAATVIAGGVALGLMAATTFSLSLAHAIHWWASPAGTDPAWLPIGVCYAVVGGVLAAISGGFLYWGRLKLRSVPPWQNLADQNFLEPMPWTTTNPN